MKNVYICGCLGFKDEIHKKTYDEILDEIFNNPSNYSIFVRMKVETDLYICCVRMIEFCYKCNRWYFFNKTCRSQMSSMVVSCFSLLKFGFREICKVCICPLQVKLLPFLIKIK